MATKQHEERRASQERQAGRERRSAAIGRHVLGALGQPGACHRVEVRELWEGHYRVNVLVGAEVACVRVAHSFFLVADGEGNVVESSPVIARRY